jgi:hypothetical protein
VLVASPDRPEVVVLESLTGTARGAISVSSNAGEVPTAGAFHHGGRWAACLTSAPSGGELVVVDTVTGQETVRTRLPVSGAVLQWCGDDHLLLDGRRLVSLRAENVVWNYELSPGMHCREPIDGRHWYVAANSPNDKHYTLYGASLPESAVQKPIESALLPKNILFQPGDAIRLEVIADGAGPGTVGGKILESLTKRYAASKSAASSEARATLTVRPYDPTPPKAPPKVSSNSGASLLNRPPSEIELLTRTTRGKAPPKAPDSPPAVKVPTAPLSNVWELTLSVDKTVVWQTWLTADSKGAALVSSAAEAKSLRDTTEGNIQMAVAALLALEPPKYAFSPGAGQGAGESKLTTQGPRRAQDE